MIAGAAMVAGRLISHADRSDAAFSRANCQRDHENVAISLSVVAPFLSGRKSHCDGLNARCSVSNKVLGGGMAELPGVLCRLRVHSHSLCLHVAVATYIVLGGGCRPSTTPPDYSVPAVGNVAEIHCPTGPLVDSMQECPSVKYDSSILPYQVIVFWGEVQGDVNQFPRRNVMVRVLGYNQKGKDVTFVSAVGDLVGAGDKRGRNYRVALKAPRDAGRYTAQVRIATKFVCRAEFEVKNPQ